MRSPPRIISSELGPRLIVGTAPAVPRKTILRSKVTPEGLRYPPQWYAPLPRCIPEAPARTCDSCIPATSIEPICLGRRNDALVARIPLHLEGTVGIPSRCFNMRLQVQLRCKHFLQTSKECDVLLRERVRIRTTMAHTLHGMHYPLTQLSLIHISEPTRLRRISYAV